ncbi:hypothetical protein A3715_17595 [Oleiphilus sp. HI0009]|nr:hypothetical protein A3715_38320 [Oleiphilus sp. HI0009]KZX84577.1 hypothetical protein A3715_17595 [Oleiphilus sp. HI0009]
MGTTKLVIIWRILPEAHARVKRLGAIDFLKKPIDRGQLISLCGLLRSASFKKERRSTSSSFYGLLSFQTRSEPWPFL